MKIGVYGGSFNPCHLMHKELVLKLLAKKIFDRIIILPTGNFYKKSNMLKGEERINLLEIMFKDNPQVIICDYEFKNNLICTYRSLDFLANIYKGDTIYFILGSDNLLTFETWKRYQYILKTYNLLVINRQGIDISKKLEEFAVYEPKIEIVDLNLNSTSSSDIRTLLANRDYAKVKPLLDEKVYDYIIGKGFYQPDYIETPITEYMSDEQFLKSYNSDSYEKMSVTADITLFSVSDKKKVNYRSIDKKAFSILLVKRTTPPFMGKWCLPGGFLSLDETLEDCATRVLVSEANLDNIYLEQLYTFSEVERDIRTRVLSTCYFGLVDQNKITTKLNPNAHFFNISISETHDTITITLNDNDIQFQAMVRKTINKFGLEKFIPVYNENLAFDNLVAIITSIKRLQSKINYTDIAFHLLPEKFTLKELQLVFEAILDKKIFDPVFRRNMKDKVVKLNEVRVDGAHRPAALYCYKENENE